MVGRLRRRLMCISVGAVWAWAAAEKVFRSRTLLKFRSRTFLWWCYAVELDAGQAAGHIADGGRPKKNSYTVDGFIDPLVEVLPPHQETSYTGELVSGKKGYTVEPFLVVLRG